MTPPPALRLVPPAQTGAQAGSTDTRTDTEQELGCRPAGARGSLQLRPPCWDAGRDGHAGLRGAVAVRAMQGVPRLRGSLPSNGAGVGQGELRSQTATDAWGLSPVSQQSH